MRLLCKERAQCGTAQEDLGAEMGPAESRGLIH